MYRKHIVRLLWTSLFLCAGFRSAWAAETEQIQVKLTKNGLESLTYAGVEYCDPSDCGVLGFNDRPTRAGNLWEPCVLDAQKSKTPFSPKPTAASVEGPTVTKTYSWGTLAATYTVKGADLYVTATITNTSATPIAWWKANLLQLNKRLVFDAQPHNTVFPFGYTPNMHWDYCWQMWWGQDNGYETWNFTDPHVYWWVDKAAPFDQAPVKVMFADLDPKWQTGVYHVKTDHGDAWPVIGATDGDPGGGHDTPRLTNGKSETVRVVLRFRPATASALEVCADGYEAFGRAYPRTVRWTDRRPIGTYFGCRGNNMGGTNTNGWFNDKTVDIDTPAGRKTFAQKLLAEIDTTIGVLKDVDAQGVIWWDLEGARNPQMRIARAFQIPPDHTLSVNVLEHSDGRVDFSEEFLGKRLASRRCVDVNGLVVEPAVGVGSAHVVSAATEVGADGPPIGPAHRSRIGATEGLVAVRADFEGRCRGRPEAEHHADGLRFPVRQPRRVVATARVTVRRSDHRPGIAVIGLHVVDAGLPFRIEVREHHLDRRLVEQCGLVDPPVNMRIGEVPGFVAVILAPPHLPAVVPVHVRRVAKGIRW